MSGEDENKRKPTAIQQVFLVVLSTAITGALTAGGNAWLSLDRLDSLVKSTAADHGKDILRIDQQMDVIRQELRAADDKWHSCVERTARLENYIDFVLERQGKN